MSQATATHTQTTKPADQYHPKTVRELIVSISTAAGISPDDATIFADALIEADMCGTSTHGISRLNIYIQRIKKGLIDPTAKLEVERRKNATLVLDARNGLGQVQATKALEKLIPVARHNGVAACTVHNSQHFGALSYYCNQAAEQNMVLLATTNCEPSMSPAGGREAYFGTNPLACSFPTNKGYPVKIDLATSLVARGNIITAQKKGESIPSDWALSKDGKPTTDAAEALDGTMRPIAGHKGYALALMVEVLSGVLSGAAIGSSIGSMYDDMNRKQNVGHFFCLLDISAFMDVNTFKQRMDNTIDEIKSCEKRPGVENILIPGERSHKKAKKNQNQGITIEKATKKELQSLCKELDIEDTLN